ncbi:MAG: hypothetical protein DRP74_06750 [Candidatus Omnitrophota bacterium]|nr:MAG: hypothetical protein DRP74_06750 [Candidatus Omnitrophota bacterium]
MLKHKAFSLLLLSIFILNIISITLYNVNISNNSQVIQTENSNINTNLYANTTTNPNGNSNFWDFNVNVTVDSGNLTQIQNITVDLYHNDSFNNDFLALQPNKLLNDDWYGFYYQNMTGIFDNFQNKLLTQDELHNWVDGNDINATWYGKTLNITNGLIMLKLHYLNTNNLTKISYHYANGTEIASINLNFTTLEDYRKIGNNQTNLTLLNEILQVYNISTSQFQIINVGNDFEYLPDLISINVIKIFISCNISLHFQLQRGLKAVQFYYNISTNKSFIEDIWSFTFDQDGYPPAGWDITKTSLTTVEVDNIQAGHTKVLDTHTNGYVTFGNNAYAMGYFERGITIGSVSLDMYIDFLQYDPGVGVSYYLDVIFWLYGEDSTGNTKLACSPIWYAYGSPRQIAVYRKGGISGAIGYWYMDNWVNYNITFNTNWQKWSLYTNGELDHLNETFYDQTYGITKITAMAIGLRWHGPGTEQGIVYFDNIKKSWEPDYNIIWNYSSSIEINRFRVDWNGSRYNLTNDEPLEDYTLYLNSSNQNSGIYNFYNNNTVEDFSILTNFYPNYTQLITKGSKYINFDGNSEYINCSDALDYNVTDPFSISLWIRYNTPDSDYIIYPFITKFLSLFDVYGIVGYILNGKIYFELYDENNDQVSKVTSERFNDGNWHHIVLTNDGTNDHTGLAIYIDGSLTTGSGWGSNIGNVRNSFDCLIGGHEDVCFVGDIDEVSIWNKSLSLSEIQELYNNKIRNYDITTHSSYINCQNWWKMGENDEYPMITDQVGNNNGNMTNMESDDIKLDTKSITLNNFILNVDIESNERYYQNFICNVNSYYSNETLRSQYNLIGHFIGLKSDYPIYPSLYNVTNNKLLLDSRLYNFDENAQIDIELLINVNNSKTKEIYTISPELSINGTLIDDFNDNSLNTSLWNYYVSPVESNGYLTCDNQYDTIYTVENTYYGIGRMFGSYIKMDTITNEAMFFGLYKPGTPTVTIGYFISTSFGEDNLIKYGIVKDYGLPTQIVILVNSSFLINPYEWHFYAIKQLNTTAWNFYVDGEYDGTINFPESLVYDYHLLLQESAIGGSSCIVHFDSIWELNEITLTYTDIYDDLVEIVQQQNPNAQIDRILSIKFHHSIQTKWLDLNPKWDYRVFYRFQWVDGYFSEYAPHRLYSNILNISASSIPDLTQTTGNWTFSIRPFCMKEGWWNSRIRIFNQTNYYEYNYQFYIDRPDVYVQSVNQPSNLYIYNEIFTIYKDRFDVFVDGTPGTYSIILNSSVFNKTVKMVYANNKSISFTNLGNYLCNITVTLSSPLDLDIYFENRTLNPILTMWYYKGSTQIFITENMRISIPVKKYLTIYVMITENPNTSSDCRFYMWKSEFDNPDTLRENRTDYSFTMNFYANNKISLSYHCRVNDSYDPSNSVELSFIIDFTSYETGGGSDPEDPTWYRSFIESVAYWLFPLGIIFIVVISGYYVQKWWREEK